jgi:hypothetical protein
MLNLIGSASHYCHKWPVRAVERFHGPWNHTLAWPILIIGNTADPVTPLASAKVLADMLGDSAILIEEETFGHTSSLKSDCTNSAIKEYFTAGKVGVTFGIFKGSKNLISAN